MPGGLSARLLTWLRNHLGDKDIDYVSAPFRLPGGTDTRTFRFSLRGAPLGYETELILRLFPAAHNAHRAAKESFVQNVLFREGYPVARVYATCTNWTVLGNSFLIMQRLPGVPMLHAATGEVPEMLGEAHASLHERDPSGVVATLNEKAWMGSRDGLEYLLGNMRRRAAVFPQFEPIVGWLLENQPPEPVREMVCHGDFHPLNLLVREGVVSGVLDWANFAVGDPAGDVAFTMIALELVGRQIFEVPDAGLLAARYIASYQAQRGVDAERLHYHRIKHSALALLCGAEGRPLWRYPPIARELVGWVQAQTGIVIELAYGSAAQ